MKGFRNLFSFCSFAICLFAIIQFTEASKKKPVCLSSEITVETFTALDYHEYQSNAVRTFFAQESSNLSPIGQRLGEILVCHMESSDSCKLRSLIYRYVVLMLSIFRNNENRDNYCGYGTFVNESVIFEETGKNCHEVTAAFLNIANQVDVVAGIYNYTTLIALGCKIEADPPTFRDAKCYKQGVAIDAAKALNVLAKSLPCNIFNTIVELSNSQHYIDRLMSLLFLAVTPHTMGQLFEEQPQNTIVEAVNISLEGHNPHCCQMRKARIVELVATSTSQMATNVQSIIDEYYHKGE